VARNATEQEVSTMDDIVIASSEADATAAAAVEQHHAQMAGGLALRVETLMSAASRSDPPAAEAARSSCGCGEVDGPEYPELDARAVPHAIRHATIFGALDSVRPGGGLILVAPHDPIPLLAQIEQRSPGVFKVDYLERGPEAWRLSFAR